LGGELPMKPVGTDARCILITHTMIDKSGVRNDYKIFREFATGSAESEGIFTDRSLRLKSKVL